MSIKELILVEEAELAERIDDLLDQVAAGDAFAITRAGEIVARLVSCDEDI